jgi:hypothetical protein
MFTKTFERRIYLLLVILLGSGAVGATFGFYALWPANVEQGYEPEQPIAFSHALHAGSGKYTGRDGTLKRQLQIECVYCHSNVEDGPQATVPPVSTCMNCHSEVQTKVEQILTDDHHHPLKDENGVTKTEMVLQPELAKLLDYYENEKPIEWVKVNDLADFVFFDHSRHIAAGLDCTECHGPVDKMERVRRENSLKMAWCLECHMQEPTEITSPEYSEDNYRGPIHCSACHR